MICSSNASQFINSILSDNSAGCRRSNCVGGVNSNGCSRCGCNSCGCNSCGCLGGVSSNGCSNCSNNSCGCDSSCDCDDDRCGCSNVISNHLLFQILQELQAIKEILCDQND